MDEEIWFLISGMVLTGVCGFLIGVFTLDLLGISYNCPDYNFAYNLSCPQISCPSVYCPQLICENCQHSNFENVWIDMVKEHTYDFENYNCVHSSNELMRRYVDLGYDAETVLVKVNCSSGLFDIEPCEKTNGWHQIVKIKDVYIDSFMGIIQPKDYGTFGIE